MAVYEIGAVVGVDDEALDSASLRDWLQSSGAVGAQLLGRARKGAETYALWGAIAPDGALMWRAITTPSGAVGEDEDSGLFAAALLELGLE